MLLGCCKLSAGAAFSAHADGRFLLIAEPEAKYSAEAVKVVLNWPSQLAQK